MKNIIIAVLTVLVLGLGAYLFVQNGSSDADVTQVEDVLVDDISDLEDGDKGDVTQVTAQDKGESVIGVSLEGRDIVAYHYGEGETEILFVGGIHGGYSWNTTLVAHEAMDYFKDNLDVVPKNVKVTIIPVLNPDGLYKVLGTSTIRFSQSDVSPSQVVQVSGRFNANDVDLNRNFDCDWQVEGTWQSRKVSGGDKAFSEAESQAIQQYVEAQKLKAVIVWYSAAGGVFASNCHTGILSETRVLTNTYADASGYLAYEDFDFYQVTGDMVNWLAKKQIPAISVLLTNHIDTEWTKNRAGIQAVLEYYAE